MHETVVFLLRWRPSVPLTCRVAVAATDYPAAPSSVYAGWRDPSLQPHETTDPSDSSWRIYHEVISRTWRTGDDRLGMPSAFARSSQNMSLVKDPAAAVTAISPPEVARHVRIMVTDPTAIARSRSAQTVRFCDADTRH